MYPYVSRVLLICYTCMLHVFTRMYSYATRMLPVCTRVLPVCIRLSRVVYKSTQVSCLPLTSHESSKSQTLQTRMTLRDMSKAAMNTNSIHCKLIIVYCYVIWRTVNIS